MNMLKHFRDNNEKHEIPEDAYVIHYLGLKPWKCNRDYDCNWDIKFHSNFASDSVYKRWWKVHDGMAKELQYYCGDNKEGEMIIRQRVEARNNVDFTL
ncbi:putative nucleotide-diphospho-sugar transferase [Lupinus albus]|uniref:Putative nucleotide-diphospho-sugar transferase n=1 Tax=Lupinus albus TaxID=3870 RepID=A0A6A4P257_LUPAL|nr:putative nucleotide-diphospho-sugar transferase [Lupinus albus]